MRALACLCYILVLSSSVFFAQPPGELVHWRVGCKRLSTGEYQLDLAGLIKGNWYIYPKSDSKIGLEAPSISWDGERVVKTGRLDVPMSVQVHDVVFGKQLSVYKETVNFSQRIQFEGKAPQQFGFVVNGYASQ